MDVRRTDLANGVCVVTASIPQVESASVGLWVGVGGRYEAAKDAGVSHFIEHLLFKGTTKRSARDISCAIEGRGGYLNAFTQEESTCFYARVPYDRLKQSFEVLADMHVNSRFDAREIDRERGVIVEEIMMYRDQPQHVVQEMLTAALWQRHPLGTPIIGFPDTLKGLSRERIVGFHARHYVGCRTVAAFAGRVDHDACVAVVQTCLGHIPRGRRRSCRKVNGSVGQAAFEFACRDIEQAHLALGFRVFGRRDERRYPLKVMSAILGENMSSRLFQVVRERRGLAYSIHSSSHLFDDSGALVISAGLDRRRYVDALRLIVRELDRLRERPVGRAELRRAKDYVIGQLRLGLESTSSQMLWIGDNILSYGEIRSPEVAIEKIAAVSGEDVQMLSRHVLTSAHASLGVISPDLNDATAMRLREAMQAL
jgi:predicted Zn-dependent peptidase